MNILILMSGGFDTYGPSRHLYKALIEDLLKSGNSVHLVETHSTGKDPDVPVEFSSYETFSYQVINRRVVKKRHFVRRYLNEIKYVIACKKRLRQLRKSHSFDIVFIQSLVCAPLLVPSVKGIMKTLTVWNIQDMFPGSSIANGVLKNKLLIKFFYRFHKKAYKAADYITVISEDMMDKVIAQGFDKNRIEVIYDWFDDQTVKNIDWAHNLFVQKYNLNHQKFYVQFAGTMGFNFDYKVVIEVAKLLKNEHDIIFHMIGFGSQLDDFKQAASNNELDNIVFLPLQEQNMVSHVYSSASIAIIPLPQGVIGNSVPSKIGLLMACKKPVISSADSDSHYIEMINSNKFGFGFSPTDYEKIADKILYLNDHRELLEQLGVNGYNYGKVIYSRTYNTQKYIDFFERIISNGEKN